MCIRDSRKAAKTIKRGSKLETVLIADDEINIREGLKNIIDWNELGFEVCEMCIRDRI